MLEKTRGIVLHHIKYGDSSLICHFYTLDSGRRSFIMKGVRSKKSKFKPNLFSVLNILNLEYYNKEGKELLVLKEVNRAKVFHSIPFDLKKSAQAMLMAEVLDKCLVEQAPDTATFEYLKHSIEYFDLMKSNYFNFHLSFLMKLTRYLGILPSLPKENRILSLYMLEGQFSNIIPDHFQYVGATQAELLYQLFTHDFDTTSRLSLNRKERNSLLDDILKFYTLNGYKMDKLNSMLVLKDIFSE
jgi:DNA repair protein RecO (recombination protein O)